MGVCQMLGVRSVRGCGEPPRTEPRFHWYCFRWQSGFRLPGIKRIDHVKKRPAVLLVAIGLVAAGAPDGLAAVRYKWSPSRSRVRKEHSAAAWF